LPVARALRGQTVKGFQHLLAQADTQDKILVSVTSMPMMNSAGEITGSSSALVELETQEGTGVGDVTGLWRGSWFTQAPVPFFGLDQDGMILDLNQAACQALNLRREQAIGLILIDRFIVPEDQGPARSYCQASLKDDHGSEAIDIVLRIKTLDGRYFSYLVSAWGVKASSVGDMGLTLMALPHDGLLIDQKPAAPHSDPQTAPEKDKSLRLEDYALNEALRAQMGIGQWVYDPESDSIIEDEGMRALIGRQFEDGPTRIHPDDQGRTDKCFMELLSGEIDQFSLSIVIENDSTSPQQPVRTLILTGQVAKSGPRIPYGLAFDKDLILDYLPANREPLQAFQELDVIRPVTDAVDQNNERLTSQIQYLQESLAHLSISEATLKQKLDALMNAPTPQMPTDFDHNAETAKLKQSLSEVTDALASEIYSWKEAPLERQLAPKLKALVDENQDMKTNKRKLEIEIYELKSRLNALMREQDQGIVREAIDAEKRQSEEALSQLRREATESMIGLQKDLEALKLSLSTQAKEYEAKLSQLTDKITQEQADHALTQQALLTLKEAEIVPPQIELRPDPSQTQRIAELEFELFKAKANQDDSQKRLLELASALEAAQKTPMVDMGPLEARMLSLEGELQMSQAQQSRLQTTVEQLTLALNQAQRFETIGRLTADVAVDFAQMLSVVNHALELMNHQSDNAEQVKKLSEAALTAGKRGERLTRQIQAFNQSDW